MARRTGFETTMLRWAAGALGFALGGFFDGILLHQILQWHHLMSAVVSPLFGSLEAHIVADGVFHVLMYAVAAVGLWLLWFSRDLLRLPRSGWIATGAGLIGFGTWHIIDTVLVHWILVLHRIRMDSDNPLLWDLLWLILFGIIPAGLGWLALRRGQVRPIAQSRPEG